jgi:hypothetical protein
LGNRPLNELSGIFTPAPESTGPDSGLRKDALELDLLEPAPGVKIAPVLRWPQNPPKRIFRLP